MIDLAFVPKTVGHFCRTEEIDARRDGLTGKSRISRSVRSYHRRREPTSAEYPTCVCVRACPIDCTPVDIIVGENRHLRDFPEVPCVFGYLYIMHIDLCIDTFRLCVNAVSITLEEGRWLICIVVISFINN